MLPKLLNALRGEVPKADGGTLSEIMKALDGPSGGNADVVVESYTEVVQSGGRTIVRRVERRVERRGR